MDVKLRNSMLLLVTALVWGVAFVAQDVGMDYLEPFTFNGIRNLLGAAVLLPVIFVRDRRAGEKATKWSSGTLWAGGFLCGITLCIASCFQQYGIKLSDASVGKAGFITACYIILVPIFGIFLKKRCPKTVWAAAVAAVVGLYFLCIPKGAGLKVEFSDLLVFVCAAMFAVQIMAVDFYSPKLDGVKLACIEFFVSGVVCSALALVFDDVSIKALAAAWLPIVYAGALSCGVGYTLQIVAQKGLDPTVASLIMSLESCISVIAAWIIQGKAMDARQIAGCAVMFAAIVLAQMPEKKKIHTRKEALK